MSWASFEPDSVADHPAAFVGPNVASAVVQSLETGILINHSIRFWARASNEPKIIKLLVSFVSIVAAFQTCIAFYNTWRVVVLGFGDWGNVVDLGWPDRIQPALNCIMAAPFQAFLIWRCWTAMGRRWIILAPLVTLLLATVIMNIFITSEVFSMFSNISFTLSATKLTGPPREYMTAFVLTAVLDILITILMLWVLLQVKSQALSKRFEKTLTRVLRMMWEAAIPPCACAVAACIIYREMSQENFWDVFFQSILGKLYVISLFVILNGRADLRRAPSALTPLNASAGLARYWAAGAPTELRVNFTSVVDRPNDSELQATPTTEGQDSEVRARMLGKNGNIVAAGSLLRRPPTVVHRSVGLGDLRPFS